MGQKNKDREKRIFNRGKLTNNISHQKAMKKGLIIQ
jgi:hypothetical protein